MNEHSNEESEGRLQPQPGVAKRARLTVSLRSLLPALGWSVRWPCHRPISANRHLERVNTKDNEHACMELEGCGEDLLQRGETVKAQPR